MQNISAASSRLKSDIISVFITNLGKYNEGELIGEWFALPSTKEALHASFKRSGIDGIRYEEFFLTDYESTINGLSIYINEYSSLDALNYLAAKLNDLHPDEQAHYESLVELGDNLNSLNDLINLIDNLDCYQLMEDIQDEYDLGHYFIEESGCYDLSSIGNLASYVDYERFGCDVNLDLGGSFTSHGYVYQIENNRREDFDGIHIPEEYTILN